jgi:hypothetical protein
MIAHVVIRGGKEGNQITHQIDVLPNTTVQIPIEPFFNDRIRIVEVSLQGTPTVDQNLIDELTEAQDKLDKIRELVCDHPDREWDE